MSAHFEDFKVSPQLPTTLEDQEWLSLPASDFSFYPAVNSYLLPGPVDGERLRAALSRTLQFFPAHCGYVARHPLTKTWQIRLLNRAVTLTLGTTNEPGPFAQNWKGERHPDYYDELPRGNTTSSNGLDVPLFRAKVTTWNKTGQTAIFVSQSYTLGDAFAILWFMKFWSQFYQGQQPSFIPSFEKYHLPCARIRPKSSHAADLAPISFMIADFSEDSWEEHDWYVDEHTERIDYTCDGKFVEAVWAMVQEQASGSKVGRSDAFSGYLVSVVQALVDKPVEHLHQLIALRGRTFQYNEDDYHLPVTTTGNAYMINSCELDDASRQNSPLRAAITLKDARKSLFSDSRKLGRTYMLYNWLYQRALDRDRIFMDAGYKDAIAINWLEHCGMTDPHFGYKDQIQHLEWESLENFCQVWKANATKQPDGSWRADPNGLQILLRLRKGVGQQFKQKLEADRRTLLALPLGAAKL